MFKFRPRKEDEPILPEERAFLEPSATKKSDRFQGWRFGVLTCTGSTCLVLAVNIALARWALAQHGWGKDGQPILHEGKCDTISRLGTGIHLLINGMGTTLLCASSYCVQCLSAPTRQELDQAHSRQSWLDIGVLSPRNLKSISKSRRIRWLILGLSTVPLHLFYNSVVFASTGTTLYYPLLVKESLLESDHAIEPSSFYQLHNLDQDLGKKNPDVDLEDLWSSDVHLWTVEAERLRVVHAQGGLQRLENRDCIKAYATQFQTRGSLFLITKSDTFTDQFLSYLGGPWATQDWICGSQRCDDRPDSPQEVKSLWKSPETWAFNFTSQKGDSIAVAYCLSETLPEKCRLQLSLPLSIIVIFFNVMKAICMLTILLKLDEKTSSPPIMNLGDTVASFLDRSDGNTKEMGLTSLNDLRRALSMSHPWDTRPKEFKGERRLRFRAASRTRWALTCILYIGMLAFTSWLLRHGIAAALSRGGVTALQLMRSLGFGQADVRTMIYSRTKDLITNAMIANLPQVILSWVYFSYNGLLTLLALAREWESYALQAKGLRVSGVPQGAQRSTYFLQLPYRIALPFMVLSAFLHWLVSQSFFLVSVQLYSYDAAEGWKPVANNHATRVSIGYSLLPMMIGVATGGFLLVAIIAAGCVPFTTAMPVVSSCSAAISAACQPIEEDDSEAAISRVQWGVMGRFKSGAKHCGFSRKTVQPPIVGRRYR